MLTSDRRRSDATPAPYAHGERFLRIEEYIVNSIKKCSSVLGVYGGAAVEKTVADWAYPQALEV